MLYLARHRPSLEAVCDLLPRDRRRHLWLLWYDVAWWNFGYQFLHTLYAMCAIFVPWNACFCREWGIVSIRRIADAYRRSQLVAAICHHDKFEIDGHDGVHFSYRRSDDDEPFGQGARGSAVGLVTVGPYGQSLLGRTRASSTRPEAPPETNRHWCIWWSGGLIIMLGRCRRKGKVPGLVRGRELRGNCQAS